MAETARESIERPLGPFSGYRIEAKAYDHPTDPKQGQLEIRYYGKEQMDAGLTGEPALTVIIGKDGEFGINGPSPESETFKAFKERGWAEEAKQKDGVINKEHTRLINPHRDDGQFSPSQVKDILADAHARLRAWRKEDRVGLNWGRATGATGGEFGNEGAAFFQNDTSPRGFFDPKTRDITLLPRSDLSTYLHESGHLYLEVMASLAAHETASEGLRADMDAALKWFGVKGENASERLAAWNAMTLEEKRNFHEKWAESFEQYLFEGVAPSPELREAFKNFRQWLTYVYKSMAQFLVGQKNAKLNDEMRGVFGKPVLRKEGGLSPDAMAEALSQFNYLPLDEHGKWDILDLEDLLREEAAGNPQYSTDVDMDVLLGEPQRAFFDAENVEYMGGRLNRIDIRNMFDDIQLAEMAGIDPYTGEAVATEPQQEGESVLFQRSQATKENYEKRIDELFAGEKAARKGVRILDRADVLDLLGFGDKPLHLQESAVGKLDGKTGEIKHLGMTAEMWKKVPEWIENPVAVFKSQSVPGALVVFAPDLVNGRPVRITIEPSRGMAGMDVHVTTNAYEEGGIGTTPVDVWAKDKKALLYLDEKESPTWLANAGLQLPRVASQPRSSDGKILTEADIVNGGSNPNILKQDEINDTKTKPRTLESMGVLSDDGIQPDLLADAFGFPSVEAMVKALLTAPDPVSAIKRLTDEIMVQRHADLATPQAIEQAALAALHSEAHCIKPCAISLLRKSA
ncbi:MAG: hypothetical protein R3E67_06635 [Pseudomonadales bacterium]